MKLLGTPNVGTPNVFPATEQGYDFRFEAFTNKRMPNGDFWFSGLLVRDGKLWKARAFIATTWAVPADSQEKAVENCVEDAVKSFAADEARKLRLDAEIERQRQQAVERNERLRQYIRAHEVDMRWTEKPALNSVVLSGLTQKEIELFFGVVVESFKREDAELPKRSQE